MEEKSIIINVLLAEADATALFIYKKVIQEFFDKVHLKNSFIIHPAQDAAAAKNIILNLQALQTPIDLALINEKLSSLEICQWPKTSNDKVKTIIVTGNSQFDKTGNFDDLFLPSIESTEELTKKMFG